MAPRPLPEIEQEVIGLRTHAKHRLRHNAGIITSGIVTFGNIAADWFNTLPDDMQDEAFLAVAQALAERLNTRVESIVVHNDETTIHAHFELRGYSDEGQPLSNLTPRSVLSELQDLTAQILQGYCPQIERGHRKSDRLKAGATVPETMHRSVRQLHHDLPIELATRETELASVESQIGDGKATLAELEADIVAATSALAELKDSAETTRRHLGKLHAKLDLTDKEVKRRSVYLARLDKKETEIAAQEAALAAKQAALVAAQRILTVEKAEVDAKETFISEVVTEFAEGRITIEEKSGQPVFQNPPAMGHLPRSFLTNFLSPIFDVVAAAREVDRQKRWVSRMVGKIRKLLPSFMAEDPLRKAADEVVREWDKGAEEQGPKN